MGTMRVCYFCGTVLEETVKVFRSSLCPGCSKDLKICLNCRFYSEGAHWECLETVPEPVIDKERSNFCDYFQFRDSSAAAGHGNEQRHQKAQRDFGKLFGDGV